MKDESGTSCYTRSQLDAMVAGSTAAGAPNVALPQEAPDELSASGEPVADNVMIAPNGDNVATSTPPATNDNHVSSAEEAGHEDDQAQEQEGNPKTQPDETTISATQLPAPSPERANDNPQPQAADPSSYDGNTPPPSAEAI